MWIRIASALFPGCAFFLLYCGDSLHDDPNTASWLITIEIKFHLLSKDPGPDWKGIAAPSPMQTVSLPKLTLFNKQQFHSCLRSRTEHGFTWLSDPVHIDNCCHAQSDKWHDVTIDGRCTILPPLFLKPSALEASIKCIIGSQPKGFSPIVIQERWTASPGERKFIRGVPYEDTWVAMEILTNLVELEEEEEEYRLR
jgi:hypothetical protein